MLTIVIPVINQIETTKECIRHIKTNSSKHIDILIIDNGSDLSIQDELKRLCDIYIRNDENIGLINSLNQGWKNCRSEFILFMHNDLFILEKDWDTRVESVLSSEMNIGVAGFGGGDGVTKDGLRQNFTSNMVNAEDHGWRIKSNYIPSAVQDGMALIVKRKLLEEIKEIAKEYNIHHFYDLDLCLEAIYRGYKVATIGISISHLGGITSCRLDYINYLKSKNTTDLQIHRHNQAIFNSKWGDRFPIDVDSQFKYRDARGEIKTNKVN